MNPFIYGYGVGSLVTTVIILSVTYGPVIWFLMLPKSVASALFEWWLR